MVFISLTPSLLSYAVTAAPSTNNNSKITEPKCVHCVNLRTQQPSRPLLCVVISKQGLQFKSWLCSSLSHSILDFTWHLSAVPLCAVRCFICSWHYPVLILLLVSLFLLFPNSQDWCVSVCGGGCMYVHVCVVWGGGIRCQAVINDHHFPNHSVLHCGAHVAARQ